MMNAVEERGADEERRPDGALEQDAPERPCVDPDILLLRQGHRVRRPLVACEVAPRQRPGPASAAGVAVAGTTSTRALGDATGVAPSRPSARTRTAPGAGSVSVTRQA